MRAVLEEIVEPPDCVSLAYDAWAPVGHEGKVPDDRRARWLGQLADIPVTPDYAVAYQRWRASFRHPGDRTLEIKLASRLLVGHGNSAASEVGLTTHHTWGVPIIPGTALKGLLSHYLDAVYGGEEGERADYQGPVWNGRRVLRGPGKMHRALFGAPEADQDRLCRERGMDAGASRGAVVFHDALYVPGSAPEDRPFAADVLTVHQKPYYDSAGANAWPNDHDDPVPVGFLSVRPCVRFLLALSGEARWTARAERLLLDALAGWGVGGKTSAGYGRVAHSPATTPPAVVGPRYRRGDRITVTRVEDRKGGRRFRADDGCPGHFAGGEQTPAVEIGQTAEVWVANAGGGAYTLTLRPPRAAKR